MKDMQQAVAAAVTQVIVNLQPPQGIQGSLSLQGQQGLQGQPEPAGSEISSSTTSMQVSFIGFFNPFLSADNGAGDVVQVEKDVFYLHVNLFINKVKSVAAAKGEEVVHQNLADSL
ncbi:MAG: hypothetical protein M1835_006940 [Candelina submexicana]|nr:MAG: hypothetical protein M1835_006940 [Candelina submexicana]